MGMKKSFNIFNVLKNQKKKNELRHLSIGSCHVIYLGSFFVYKYKFLYVDICIFAYIYRYTHNVY